jgi:hypothetical protein
MTKIVAACRPNDRIFTALLRAAEKIGERSRAAYMAQIRRDRRGRVTQGYRLNEGHQRVMDTIDAYARCKIGDEQALSVLHEYDVNKARFGKK